MLPSGDTSLNTNGATGSLKCNTTCAGAVASRLDAAGCASISAACAWALSENSCSRAAATRMKTDFTLGFGDDRQRRRRALGWLLDVDPARYALFTFLHDREVHHAPRWQICS